VRTSHWVSDVFTAQWIDRGVIDGVLHGIAHGALGLGSILRNFFDLPVINGAGDAVSTGVKQAGSSLRVIQSGRVQQYLVTGICVMVAFGILFYFLLALA
jgi:NADH-quinone oxidoreductase subunit L